MTSSTIDSMEPVLLIEDDPALQSLIRETLEDDKCALTVASTCAEARQALREGRFSCAVVDFGLPDGNGLDLLPEIRSSDPGCVTIALTAESRPAIVVDAMRTGAFDYLIKPVDFVALRACVARAVAHHQALRERDRLDALLSEERQQLAQRVEEATDDIRQHATQCEIANARLHSLLRLARASSDYYTDENLFTKALEEASKHAPVACMALCSLASREFIAAIRGDDGNIFVIPSGIPLSEGPSYAATLESALAECLTRHTGFDPAESRTFIFPQEFWGNNSCGVGFYLTPGQTIDKGCEEFLGTCASLVAMEWREAQLFLHATQQASLGSLAMELFKGFVQNVTAIQVATDVLNELSPSDDAKKALQIIVDDVARLHRRIGEFRRLSTRQKGSMKTMCLADCVDQAIEVLSLSLLHRDISVATEYEARCECVLLNVELLVRSLVDLLAAAIALVDTGSAIELRLSEEPEEIVKLEVVLREKKDAPAEMPPAQERLSACDLRVLPAFVLVKRAIEDCAGQLDIAPAAGAVCAFQILLPKNAMKQSQMLAGVRNL